MQLSSALCKRIRERRRQLLNTPLKTGHVEYKTAYCTDCGDEFQYPRHFKPKPIYCDTHDPNPPIPVDLSLFEASTPAVKAREVEVLDVDGAQYYRHIDEPGWEGITQSSTTHSVGKASGAATWQLVSPAGSFTPTTTVWHDMQLGTPSEPQIGNSFAASPRYRSVEAIREEYEARLERMQNPRVMELNLPSPRRGKSITVIHLGDIHIGTDACTYRAFREILDYILGTPDTYLALQGDMVDLLTAHSVGVMAEQAMTIQDQFNIATADLLPLAKAKKILWMLRGNHEDRLDKATKNIVDGAQWMARIMDVPYLGSEGYTRIRCAGQSYLSYNLHGFNVGNSPGARRNKMDSMLTRFPSADVLTCGHNHNLDVIQRIEDAILPDNTRAHRQRWGIYTGTTHSYIGYCAEQGLGTGPLGCVAVHFNLEYGEVKPEVLPIISTGGTYRCLLPVR